MIFSIVDNVTTVLSELVPWPDIKNNAKHTSMQNRGDSCRPRKLRTARPAIGKFISDYIQTFSWCSEPYKIHGYVSLWKFNWKYAFHSMLSTGETETIKCIRYNLEIGETSSQGSDYSDGILFHWPTCIPSAGSSRSCSPIRSSSRAWNLELIL